jgi:4-amino-4-deoxy-L-arabinose transferase-like glycosyltransferase
MTTPISLIRNLLPNLLTLQKKPFHFQLLLISLFAFLVRVLYVIFVEKGDPLNGDAFYYHHASHLLVDGLGFTEPYRYLFGGAQELLFLEESTQMAETTNRHLPVGHIEPTAGHPPLWVFFLAFPVLIGLDSVFTQQIFSSLIGAVGVFAIGWAAREVGSKKSGLIAAGIASIYAFLWLNDGLLMSETLVIPIVAIVVGLSARLYNKNSLSLLVLFSVVGGLAVLTRAELLFAIPFLALPILRNSSETLKKRLVRYLFVGIIVISVMTPWVVRNLVQFEEPVFLSNGSGILLAQTNCDATYFGDKQGYWEYLCALPQPVGKDGEPTDESVRDKEYRSRGIDYASKHKERLFTHAIPKRIARLWGFYSPIEQLRADKLVEGRNFSLSVIGLFQYYALLPLSILGLIKLRHKKGTLLPLITLPIVTTLVAAITMGTTRYRVSAEISIIIFAALGIQFLFEERVRRAQINTIQSAVSFSEVEK